MQERHDLPSPKINDDLLRFAFHTPLWFWFAAAGLGAILGAALISFGLMLNFGLTLLGYTQVQLWGVLITNFVFWVGISHAGVMISAILRLTQAEWRRPVTRAAEVLTVFALATAATFPLIHTAGRGASSTGFSRTTSPGGSSRMCAQPWSGTRARSLPI
jgi:Ni/Fe-hydrogenase subunit HybB-like protein